MNNTVIEVQDPAGNWIRYTTLTTDYPQQIAQALKQALKSLAAQKSKKARAVDEKTGALLDMLHG